MKFKRVYYFTVLLVFILTICVSAGQIPESWSNPKTAAELGITEFNEAPMLKELVEKGELPPVEERLPVPEDLMVIEPVDRVGEYGGTVTSVAIGPSSWADGSCYLPWMFFVDQTVSNVVPDVAKSYEFTNDNKELIIHLRKGLRWSDGHPFTVEDILFWWNDVANDPEVNHWTVWSWRLDGINPEFEKIDDYTLKITFPKPNPTIIKAVLSWWRTQQDFFYSPAHHLKQFHAKYNPDVHQVAEEAGYGSWVQFFNDKKAVGPGQQNLDLPVLGPWVLKERTSTEKVFVRNPYYFVVDTEGNQLPYVDKWVIKIKSDAEVAKLDAIQGNLDFAGRILSANELPMYKQNESVGDYKVYPWESTVSAQIGLAFNVTHPDPEKREIFGDVRFRRAMSLVINRDEINEFAYRGLATPAQATVNPGVPYFEEWWAETYAEYDPERANKILDEMGLERGSDGFRVTPMGRTLIIDMQIPTPGSVGGTAQLGTVAELIKAYWEEVGVKVNLKTISRELYQERVDSGVHDVGVWPINTTRDFSAFAFDDDGTRYAVEWQQWEVHRVWEETGREGEEPPAGIKPPQHAIEQLERLEAYKSATSEEEMYRIAKEIWNYYAEQLYIIGTVARPVTPVIVSNDLINVPEKAPFSDPSGWWKIAHPEQWFKLNN